MMNIVHNHINNVNKISIVRIYEKNLTIYVLLATERKLKKNNVNKLTASMMLLYDFVNDLLQKSEAFQSVHHVTFILCYTVL